MTVEPRREDGPGELEGMTFEPMRRRSGEGTTNPDRTRSRRARQRAIERRTARRRKGR